MRRERNVAEREEGGQKLEGEERGPVGATPLTTICSGSLYFVPGSTEHLTCIHSVLTIVLVSGAVLSPTLQRSN